MRSGETTDNNESEFLYSQKSIMKHHSFLEIQLHSVKYWPGAVSDRDIALRGEEVGVHLLDILRLGHITCHDLKRWRRF